MGKTHILGLDIGTANIGVVILEGEKIIYKETLKPKGEGVEKLEWTEETIEDLIVIHDVTDAILEGYSYMSKWRAHDLGEMGGVVRLKLHKMRVPYSVVPPPTLKKFACGKGNAKKELMMLFAYKRWGVEFEDNHICDAYCLARFFLEEGHYEKKTK